MKKHVMYSFSFSSVTKVQWSRQISRHIKTIKWRHPRPVSSSNSLLSAKTSESRPARLLQTRQNWRLTSSNISRDCEMSGNGPTAASPSVQTALSRGWISNQQLKRRARPNTSTWRRPIPPTLIRKAGHITGRTLHRSTPTHWPRPQLRWTRCKA